MRPELVCSLALVWLAGCLLPASERVELDREVGMASAGDTSVEVIDGLAAVRGFDGERLELWAQAPELDVRVSRPAGPPRLLRVDILNCARTARLLHGAVAYEAVPVADKRASCGFMLELAGDALLQLRLPGSERNEPFVFAVLSDVQDDVDRVQDIFALMNRDPELRFVVSTGDLVDTGVHSELRRFQRELLPLEVPFYSTVGNHEMGAPARTWHELFGPFSFHYTFQGVSFSLLDSGNGTIDPHVYDRLDGWLEAARSRTHVVLTHVPPLDPVGLRGGGFRSRKEAAKLLQKLGAGRADVLFLGHIHSYYAFSGAGVPSYISGGGGAIPETLDGIARHYLRVRVDPALGIRDVAVVRVD